MPAACPLTKTATDLVRKHPRQPARSLARMLVKRSRGALTVEAVVGGPCGCPERRAALNAAGAKWLGLPPGSTAPAEIDPGTP